MTRVPGVPAPLTDEVLLARAYLSRVAEPTSIPVWDWVRRNGAVGAAASIRSGDVPPAVAAATGARRLSADAEADLEAAIRHGIRLVVPESDDWPHFALAALEGAALRRLSSYRSGAARARDGGEPMPPLALWIKGGGDLASAGVRSVAIVGARAATAYGEHVTAELSYGLAARAVTIVSGGAYGIDAAAHRAALAAEGETMIVSAGGLDRPYPAAHARLYERAGETGLVVSESPPGAAPQRHRFLTRNRLIASFGAGTVIVEAAARSGALNTARHCQLLGRPLMVVPGPITSPMSAGCHALLRAGLGAGAGFGSGFGGRGGAADGAAGAGGGAMGAGDAFGCGGGGGLSAHGGGDGAGDGGADDIGVVTSFGAVVLVSSVEQVLEVVGSAGEGLEAAATVDSVRSGDDLRRLLDRLDPVARRVFDGVPARRAVREEELARRSGVTAVEVIRALPALRLAGLIEVGEEGFRVAQALRKRSRPGSDPGVAT